MRCTISKRFDLRVRSVRCSSFLFSKLSSSAEECVCRLGIRRMENGGAYHVDTSTYDRRITERSLFSLRDNERGLAQFRVEWMAEMTGTSAHQEARGRGLMRSSYRCSTAVSFQSLLFVPCHRNSRANERTNERMMPRSHHQLAARRR